MFSSFFFKMLYCCFFYDTALRRAFKNPRFIPVKRNTARTPGLHFLHAPLPPTHTLSSGDTWNTLHVVPGKRVIVKFFTSS